MTLYDLYRIARFYLGMAPKEAIAWARFDPSL